VNEIVEVEVAYNENEYEMEVRKRGQKSQRNDINASYVKEGMIGERDEF